MKRHQVVSAVIGIVSVLVAGVIAQVRDAEVADHIVRVSFGDVVEVNQGQTLTVTGYRVGRFHRGDFSSARGLSEGRFVQVHFEASTTNERGIVSMLCQLQTRRDGVLFPLDGGRVSFPESGFTLKQDLIWEVAVEDLKGLVVSCTEYSVITYRETTVNADPDLRGATYDEVLAASISNEIVPVEDELEVQS